MKDIFAGFEYACEKISENGCLKEAGYESLKQMVLECRTAFEGRYGSIDNVDFVKYHLDEIYELYDLIDDGVLRIDPSVRECVEKHLFQNLMSHIKELRECYVEDQ